MGRQRNTETGNIQAGSQKEEVERSNEERHRKTKTGSKSDKHMHRHVRTDLLGSRAYLQCLDILHFYNLKLIIIELVSGIYARFNKLYKIVGVLKFP